MAGILVFVAQLFTIATRDISVCVFFQPNESIHVSKMEYKFFTASLIKSKNIMIIILKLKIPCY